ncbi:ubiquinonemenaquinone biosynthesis [Nitrosomonas stercoris]|uniref:Ubiquinonemenaquinone biosynthesis n=1 Tax=Nitrosomonas stercoris TaxID=1444684 RepID=A0A4Y1YMK5_9PROT|nr:ubiquinonemenaquinone biosynthesis [Nitrosomonas stercoris]
MAGYIGNVAVAYDRDLGHILFERYASDIARRVARRPVSDVLEVASGTGIVTRQLRNMLPGDAQLTAIDISDAMLDVARTKFFPHEQITFRIADAVTLPFDDQAFDAVICQFGVMFFDKDKAFRETYRVLKQGGRYLFSVWDSRDYNPYASLTFEVLKQFFPSDTPRFLENTVSSFKIDPIKEMLIRAGFEQINISVQRQVYDIPDARAFARGLIFSPVISEISERDEVDPDDIIEALADTFVMKYGSNPTRFPMQAILFEAEKL